MTRLLKLVIELVFFIVVANACIDPYLPPPLKQPLGMLVVDGLMIPNDTTQIRLTRTRSLDSSDPIISEDNAIVKIESELGIAYLLKEKSQGVYVIPPIDIDFTKKYRIHITTKDEKEYASLYVPVGKSALLDSTTWEENTNDETIRFNIYAHDPQNSTWYYMWTYDETWEYVSATTSQLYFENGEIYYRNLATELYYCWKTAETNNVFLFSTKALSSDVVYNFKLFDLPQSDRKLYFGYSILVRQYSLTAEAYSYWTITKKNSEGLGTLFDPIPSQPTGNLYSISNPNENVIGYFIVSNASVARVIFDRQKIIGPSIAYSPTGYENCALEFIPTELISEKILKGKLIHEREYNSSGQFIGYSVGTEECLDCRKKGGTNIKPDYWF